MLVLISVWCRHLGRFVEGAQSRRTHSGRWGLSTWHFAKDERSDKGGQISAQREITTRDREEGRVTEYLVITGYECLRSQSGVVRNEARRAGAGAAPPKSQNCANHAAQPLGILGGRALLLAPGYMSWDYS